MASNLANMLDRYFRDATQVLATQYGYYPTRFLQMLNQYGPVDTSIRLVMDPEYHEGVTKLWELNRLDLTVEAIILREPYCRLFSDEVLSRARERLQELGYDFGA